MDRVRPLLLISLILFSCICAVQAVTLNITVVDDADDTPLRDVALSINGDYVGKTGGDGIYRYSHALNDSFYLKASKFGYEDWIDLVSPTETSLRVEMTRKSEVITIVVYDRETLRPLMNAFVKVSGENLTDTAETDEEGKAQFSLKTGGIYAIEIRASRYEPVLKTIDLSTGERTLQYWLYRNDLLIISVTDSSSKQPIENATVIVNSNPVGSTGSDGRLILNIDRERNHLIRVEKPDYDRWEMEKYITGEDLLIEVSMQKSTYPVSIAVFNEDRRPVQGARLSIDGVQKGTTDAYGRIGITTLAAGSYLLEVQAAGYESWKERRNISGHSEEIVINLLFASVNVTIRVQDGEGRPIEGANLLIDGVTTRMTDTLGEVTLPLKTGIAHNITASMEGYHTISQSKKFPLDSSPSTVTIILERELDTGLILTVLVGIVVIIGVLLAVRTFMMERRTRRPRRH